MQLLNTKKITVSVFTFEENANNRNTLKQNILPGTEANLNRKSEVDAFFEVLVVLAQQDVCLSVVRSGLVPVSHSNPFR